MMEAFSFFLVTMGFIVLASTGINDDDGTLVNTTYGLVQGKIVVNNATGLPFARHWLGIPYASPPLGNLRFKSPIPPTPWGSTVKSTINFGNTCPQDPNLLVPGDPINEDCLYLNVYAPLVNETQGYLPVMIFIYGGSWEEGSSQFPFYRGGFLQYFNGNTILVTINYRLGAFGFLASQGLIDESPYGDTGNYGVQDQRFAFQWVRDNIKNFQGDPTDVTIFGQSAGSGSVAFHLVANKSWGLFHKAVMHSGPWADWSSNSLQTAETHYTRIVTAVNCTSTTPSDEIACLRSKSMQEILDNYLDNGNLWGPTEDHVELDDQPQKLAKKGLFVRVPVMLGTVSDEATTLAGGPHNMTADQYQQKLIQDYGADLGAQVYQLYPPQNYKTPWWAYCAQWTDNAMACPARRSARWLTNPPADSGKPTTAYLWHFEHQLEVSKLDPWAGVFHGTDLPFVFEDVEVLTKVERELSANMVQYWIQFAYNSDPNQIIPKLKLFSSSTLTVWPLYNQNTDMNLVLDLNITTTVGLKKQFCDFWDSTLPF